jgi:hypothetical protein
VVDALDGSANKEGAGANTAPFSFVVFSAAMEEPQMPMESPAVGGAPAASGAMTPQQPDGEVEAAKLDAYHAVRLIDRAIGRFGKKTEQADALLKARGVLTSCFGDYEESSERFSPAEIKRMVAQLIGAGEPQQPKQGASAQPQQQQQPQG